MWNLLGDMMIIERFAWKGRRMHWYFFCFCYYTTALCFRSLIHFSLPILHEEEAGLSTVLNASKILWNQIDITKVSHPSRQHRSLLISARRFWASEQCHIVQAAVSKVFTQGWVRCTDIPSGGRFLCVNLRCSGTDFTFSTIVHWLFFWYLDAKEHLWIEHESYCYSK